MENLRNYYSALSLKYENILVLGRVKLPLMECIIVITKQLS